MFFISRACATTQQAGDVCRVNPEGPLAKIWRYEVPSTIPTIVLGTLHPIIDRQRAPDGPLVAEAPEGPTPIAGPLLFGNYYIESSAQPNYGPNIHSRSVLGAMPIVAKIMVPDALYIYICS